MSTASFAYTGDLQHFVVPPLCTVVTVDIKGAGGALGGGDAGGRVQGTLTVTPGQTLYIHVGGRGEQHSVGSGGAGGYNGGGRGGNAPLGKGGDGGGGASDIRRGGTPLTSDRLVDRVVIAGGGGGAGAGVGATAGGGGGKGGAGTGQLGGDGHDGVSGDGGHGGHGGTQLAGGAHGVGGTGASDTANDGALGLGGAGSDHSANNYCSGGGGGGGYYGGGGGGGSVGANDSPASTAAGGGGGSNYTGGLATVASSTQGGGAAAGSHGSITITYNLAPNAPTGLSPDNTLPVDKDASVPLSWGFNDDDPGDTPSAFQARFRLGSGAWTTLAKTTSTASALLLDTTTSGFPAHADQTVEWQVRTYDQADAVSPYSASAYFVLRAKPTAPSYDFTPVIDSQSPLVAFTAPDGIARYKIRVVHDNGSGGPGTAMTLANTAGATGAPSGLPTSLVTSAHNGVPPAPGVGGELFVNGQTYHFMLSYARYVGSGLLSAQGVFSNEVDSGPIICEIDAPLAPTVVLTSADDSGSIIVDITNPGSDPFAPDFNAIFRTNLSDGDTEICIASNVAVNGTFADFTPASRSTYRYRVVAIRTANGSATSSE